MSDRFVEEYTALRAQEPWAEKGRARRAQAIASAVELIRVQLGAGALIVDVGAGAAAATGVIAIDLVPPPGRLAVRGDMRRLPLADGSIDAVLYAASLHYAPLGDAVTEAARVLRPGGLLVALDSPIYEGPAAAAAARARSAAYYERAGHPLLAAHYHPIELGALRTALQANGFEVARLTLGSRWRRLARRGPDSFVLARKLR
jgi:SAM-dependent methyltransferase